MTDTLYEVNTVTIVKEFSNQKTYSLIFLIFSLIMMKYVVGYFLANVKQIEFIQEVVLPKISKPNNSVIIKT